MKTDIHPTYFPQAKVTCACGNTFTVGSTLKSLEIEICSACHPFYTGKENIVDARGQIQKFKERLSKKQEPKAKKVPVKKEKKDKVNKTS